MQAKPAAPKSGEEQAAAARAPLPKQCDNTAMLRTVVTRLDSPATADDVRSFLAAERLRLLRCEYTRFTAEELRAREQAMSDVFANDPRRRRDGMRRVEELYDRYATPADRAARPASRQR